MVTGFTVESYQWLSEDPSKIAAASALAVHQRLLDPNATIAAPGEFHPTSSEIRINIYWFLSLTIGLASAFVGILCKQWMKEFQRDPSVQPERELAIRQLRFQSWEKWRVPAIISSVSFLLQIALTLFVLGLLDLLWSLNNTVASVITAFSATAMMFVTVTAVLPTYYHLSKIDKLGSWKDHPNSFRNILPCPFRTPLSLFILQFITTIKKLRSNRLSAILRVPRRLSTWINYDLSIAWAHISNDPKVPTFPSPYLIKGLCWALSTLGDNVDNVRTLLHCQASYRDPDPRDYQSYEGGTSWVWMSSRAFEYWSWFRQYNMDQDIARSILELLVRDLYAHLQGSPYLDFSSLSNLIKRGTNSQEGKWVFRVHKKWTNLRCNPEDELRSSTFYLVRKVIRSSVAFNTQIPDFEVGLNEPLELYHTCGATLKLLLLDYSERMVNHGAIPIKPIARDLIIIFRPTNYDNERQELLHILQSPYPESRAGSANRRDEEELRQCKELIWFLHERLQASFEYRGVPWSDLMEVFQGSCNMGF